MRVPVSLPARNNYNNNNNGYLERLTLSTGPCRTDLPMDLKEYACGHLGLTKEKLLGPAEDRAINYGPVHQGHQHPDLGLDQRKVDIRRRRSREVEKAIATKTKTRKGAITSSDQKENAPHSDQADPF